VDQGPGLKREIYSMHRGILLKPLLSIISVLAISVTYAGIRKNSFT